MASDGFEVKLHAWGLGEGDRWLLNHAILAGPWPPMPLVRWIERIPGGTRETDGLEIEIMGGGLLPQNSVV